MTNVYFGIFNALAAVILVYLNYKNEELLNVDEKKRRSRALYEVNRLNRPENWGFLAAVFAIFLINYSGVAAIPAIWVHLLILSQTLYSIFRNRMIYLRLELPSKFVRRELFFRLAILAVVAVFMFFVV